MEKKKGGNGEIMQAAKHHFPFSKGKVSFLFLLFVALAGFMILTGIELFVKLTGSAFLNATKSFLFNFDNFTTLNSTAVHHFKRKICE